MFIAHDVFEILINTTKCNMGHHDIVYSGCRSLSICTEHCIDYDKISMVPHDAVCDIIIKIIQAFPDNCGMIAETLLFLGGFLAFFPSCRETLESISIEKAITRSMMCFPHDMTIMESGCVIICILCQWKQEMKIRFGLEGACKAVMDAVSGHFIGFDGVHAISSLAVGGTGYRYEPNWKEFTDLGVKDLLRFVIENRKNKYTKEALDEAQYLLSEVF